jgi:putative colanic acid biosynthesis UDP-glucose lipid carrier transferase
MFRGKTEPGPRTADANWTHALPRGSTVLLRSGFALFAAMADFAAIAGCALLAHLSLNGVPLSLPPGTYTRLGVLTAFFFTCVSAIRGDYALMKYLTFDHLLQRAIIPWTIALLCTLVLLVSRRPLSNSGPLAMLIMFVGGFIAINAVRLLITINTRARARQGRLAVHRIFLFGYEAEIDVFTKRFEPWAFGVHIVAAAVLRGADSLHDDLALARASARMLEPDDVFILVPWNDKTTIDAAIQAFLHVPTSIHLGPERVLDRFTDARIAKIGPVSSLNIVRDPLTLTERITKRTFDIVCSGLGLILLSPLLLMIALAIKLDSRGPVLFRQRRYGFNQQPFRIFKFRSMTTLEDSADLTLVEKGDARVTRVGGFIRRHNIDELPQLINVLIGDMSLVGPRPHALVIDQMFERRIALYARRHNMKPGITGWAQINGYRGGMNDDPMRARVEHDLYYIDHWSMWLDIEILWLTLTTKRGYTNAF